MPGGYAGKFLDVDLSKEKVKDTVIDDETLEAYFGGRGLGAKILWDRIGKKWSKVDALGPDNIFMALTGPMTGIYPGVGFAVQVSLRSAMAPWAQLQAQSSLQS